MMLGLVLLLSVLACARADCDACVAGLCHERRPLIRGFRVTDQLAVDRTNNVLYVQLNSNLNTAFYLDELRIELAQMMHTSGMAVDQDTQTLYTGTKMVEKTYYRYNLTSNVTEAEAVLGHEQMHPDYMFYGQEHLNFLDENSNSVLYVNKANGEIWYRLNLEDYKISDFVLDKDLKLFFVSNNTVYMYNNTAYSKTSTLIAENNHVLSADKHGDLYLGDASKRVIYKRDSATGALDVYASYQSGSVEDFVFERDNKIVFRDGDGSVARWEPAPAQARCVVLTPPPHCGFHIKVIKQFEDVDNQVSPSIIDNDYNNDGLVNIH